jgi:hypothetical protein
VDGVDVEYTRKKDTDHHVTILKTHHKVSQGWVGKNVSIINLEWNYAPNHADRMYQLSMKNYIANLLIALNYPMPNRLQMSPRRCRESKYGIKVQHAHKDGMPVPLNATNVQHVQTSVGALLWIRNLANNTLLVALRAIDSRNVPATKDTNKAIHQLQFGSTIPDNYTKQVFCTMYFENIIILKIQFFLKSNSTYESRWNYSKRTTECQEK